MRLGRQQSESLRQGRSLGCVRWSNKGGGIDRRPVAVLAVSASISDFRYPKRTPFRQSEIRHGPQWYVVKLRSSIWPPRLSVGSSGHLSITNTTVNPDFARSSRVVSLGLSSRSLCPSYRVVNLLVCHLSFCHLLQRYCKGSTVSDLALELLWDVGFQICASLGGGAPLHLSLKLPVFVCVGVEFLFILILQRRSERLYG